MRFLDSTHYDIPKPIKNANSDSSTFNFDESLSDDISSQNALISSQLSKQLIPPTTFSTNVFSKNNSPTITNDNSSFKKSLKPIKLMYLLTNHAIYLKGNLFHLTPGMTETLKLIMT